MNREQQPDPVWLRSLEGALEIHKDESPSRFVQLATRGEGPSNRTVAFRGFYSPGPGLLFATDCRSGKVHHLRRNPEEALGFLLPARPLSLTGGPSQT